MVEMYHEIAEPAVVIGPLKAVSYQRSAISGQRSAINE
jgi:hypothetical protein